MKIRIGYGLGTAGLRPGASPDAALSAAGAHGTQEPGGEGLAAAFASLVDALEKHRFDSLWLSERVTGAAPDPIVGLAVAAGRTEHLKLGMSVMVLPGRNPALVAKELA